MPVSAGGLELESVSSRFIGGRRLELTGQPVEDVALSSALPDYRHDGNDTYHVEQAYVQRFVPARRSDETPVLFVAGGGLTGACWETTPDGRPGWLTVFLRAGRRVDLLDNVERGRAGWCALPGTWPGEAIMRGEREMWDVFRIGPIEGYGRRIAYRGSQFPLDALDGMLQQGVPRWPANGELAARSLRAVVAEIGPCVLVGHSQGGGLCARVALACPGLVRQAVLIEPHGLPEPDAGGAGYPPQLIVLGDNTWRTPLWVRLTADMRRYAEQSNRLGTRVETLDLPEAGITGNSHNPMMDLNSDVVAEMILRWMRDTKSRPI